MQNNIFFEKAIIRKEKQYLYNNVVSNYLIASLLKEEKPEIIQEKLLSFYGDKTINFSKLKRLLDREFIPFKSSHFKALKETEDFKSCYEEAKKYNIDELKNKLNQSLLNPTSSVNEKLSYYFAIDNILYPKDDIYYFALYYENLFNSVKYLNEIKKIIKEIKPSFYDFPINLIINNDVINKIFENGNIKTIKDLTNIDYELLHYLFSLDYQNIYNHLSTLKEDYSVRLKEDVNHLFEKFPLKYNEIIKYRYGFFEKEKTLEEVGEIINVTRERVRQIEKKAGEIINENLSKIKLKLLSLFNGIDKENKGFFSKEDLKEFIKDDLLFNQILYIFRVGELPIKYDEKNGIIYNQEKINIKDILNNCFAYLTNALDQKNYQKLAPFEKRIIDNYYRLYKNKTYIKKGINCYDIISSLVKENFQDGYKIDSKDDYQKLIKISKDILGDDFILGSNRDIDARISERNDFCLIDRGLYKSRNDCVKLDNDFINKIIDYIKTFEPTCTYLTIYHNFKKEFNERGITNNYYVKGLIDPYLPKEFHTKRNYIQTTKERVSNYESILNFMHSFKSSFSINDLVNKFPGVKKYTFYNAIYDDTSKQKIIWLNNHNFIYIDKIDINDNTKQDLKKFILDLFNETRTDVLSSRIIFDKLKEKDPNLLKSLKIVNDYFDLYSLTKCFFQNDFIFRRPLISKNGKKKTSLSLINDYVKKYNIINSKMINDFIKKEKIRGLYSYLEYIEGISDEYVQVSKDTMYKKDFLDIPFYSLMDFKDTLDDYLKKNNQLDTRNFLNYSIFPEFPLSWNKYFLVGVIRSYFKNDYHIKNTNNAYDVSDFIITK